MSLFGSYWSSVFCICRHSFRKFQLFKKFQCFPFSFSAIETIRKNGHDGNFRKLHFTEKSISRMLLLRVKIDPADVKFPKKLNLDKNFFSRKEQRPRGVLVHGY